MIVEPSGLPAQSLPVDPNVSPSRWIARTASSTSSHSYSSVIAFSYDASGMPPSYTSSSRNLTRIIFTVPMMLMVCPYVVGGLLM